jgi:hypothetical protein
MDSRLDTDDACGEWRRRKDRNSRESIDALIYGLICAGRTETAKRLIERCFAGIPPELITYNVDRSAWAAEFLEGFR